MVYGQPRTATRPRILPGQAGDLAEFLKVIVGDETVHPWLRDIALGLPALPTEGCAAPPFAAAVRCDFARRPTRPWKLDGA